MSFYSPVCGSITPNIGGSITAVSDNKHKAGIQSNRYVHKFGLRLLPDLYEGYNPMTYDAAREMEVELGILLRDAGFGVWQA